MIGMRDPRQRRPPTGQKGPCRPIRPVQPIPRSQHAHLHRLAGPTAVSADGSGCSTRHSATTGEDRTLVRGLPTGQVAVLTLSLLAAVVSVRTPHGCCGVRRPRPSSPWAQCWRCAGSPSSWPTCRRRRPAWQPGGDPGRPGPGLLAGAPPQVGGAHRPRRRARHGPLPLPGGPPRPGPPSPASYLEPTDPAGPTAPTAPPPQHETLLVVAIYPARARRATRQAGGGQAGTARMLL